jgi:predicted Zn-dependent protease
MQAAPGNESAAHRMMELYNLLGQRDGLGAFLRNYLAAHPGQSWATVAYSKLLLEVDDAPGAERVLAASLDDKGAPTSPETAMALVKVYNLQNRPKDSLALLQKGAEKFPADDRIRFDLALCYEKLSDPTHAAAEYAKVSRKDPLVHQKASVNLAFIYERAGDARKAKEVLSAAEPGVTGTLPPAILAKIQALGSEPSRRPASAPPVVDGDKK